MFNTIIDPKTLKKVNINSKLGIKNLNIISDRKYN